jgi:hypothetical protein
MNKQDNGAGNVHQLHPEKATKIEPLEGWTVQTKYGTLRLPGEVNCVSLADVHAWMTKDGKPFDMAVSEMFDPLLRAACDVCSGYQEAEAIRIVSALHLVKPTGFPVPLFEPATSCSWDVDPLKCENVYTFSCRTIFPKGPKTIEKHVYRYVPQITFAGGIDIKTLRAAFPDQGHYACEDGTIAGLVYALSIGARRVLMAGVDLQTDVVAAWQQKKEAEDEAHHGIKWPRHEIVSAYVNRLAVPIAIAHELWGWGRVVTVEAETQAAPAGESETGKQTHHKWTLEKRQKLLDDFNKADGKLQKEKLAQVAKQWGISEDNASKQIKRARKDAKPNFGTGLGGRKST